MLTPFFDSLDILYLVLAFCLLWLTVFLSIALYYLIKLLKQFNEVLTNWRHRATTVASLFALLKTKIVAGGALGLISVVKKLFANADKTKNKNR